jgi:hypothetical protein
MLIPRFSVRWLLAATAVCSVLAYVVAQAVMGQAWGIAASVACGALLLTFLVYVAVFVVAWGIAFLGASRRGRQATSPFAAHVPPPQILPPQDPD